MKRLYIAALLGAAALSPTSASAALVYVGSFQVGQGPAWQDNPTVMSAVDAAAHIFGGDASDYHVSSISAGVEDIDYKGWYSTWGVVGGQQYAESFKFDAGAGGYRYPGGYSSAISAYVNDNAIGESYTTYVFRNELAAAAVPEPATWAMLLMGFGVIGGALRSRARIAQAAI